MFLKILRKEKRVAQWYTLLVFIAMTIAFFLATLYSQMNMDQVKKVSLEANEQSVISVVETMIDSETNGRISDLLYIVDSLRIKGFDCGNYSNIVQQWVSFSNRKTYYDQIRYIDQNGDEIIRVNYRPEGATVTEPADLQNKKDRYYFSDALGLLEDQVYISRLDLNKENNEIELPIKPMLRFSKPYFGEDGSIEGIVVLNYAADDTLKKAEEIASTSEGYIFILNKDGYWVFNNENPDKEWTFMYPDRVNENFANEFPEEWQAITGDEQGFISTENGVFSYRKSMLDERMIPDGTQATIVCASRDYYIVSYIPSDCEMGQLFSGDIWGLVGKVFTEYLSIYFLMSGIAFVLAAFIAVNKGQKKEIKYYSEYDAMTGVYNRRTGYERLNRIQKEHGKGGCKVAVCFSDINGLKEINDELGHEAGDELIVTITAIIKRSIRGNDFVARLGGDEFLIVFEGMNARDAENTWLRIVQAFEKINTEENRDYQISVSHGIGVFRCGEHETMDSIINQADAAMYQEKREIKKNLHVIRHRKP